MSELSVNFHISSATHMYSYMCLSDWEKKCILVEAAKQQDLFWFRCAVHSAVFLRVSLLQRKASHCVTPEYVRLFHEPLQQAHLFDAFFAWKQANYYEYLVEYGISSYSCGLKERSVVSSGLSVSHRFESSQIPAAVWLTRMLDYCQELSRLQNTWYK